MTGAGSARLLTSRWRALPPHHRADRFVLAVSGAGMAAVLGAVVVAAGSPVADGWRVAAVLALFVLADARFMALRVGAHLMAFTPAEAAVVLALALLPVPWAVSLAAVGVAAHHLAARRPLRKVVFNAGSVALGVLVAGFAARAGSLEPSAGTGALVTAVLLAGVAFATWTHLAVGTVIALAQGQPLRALLLEGHWVHAAVSAANLLVALGVLWLAERSPVSLVVIPPLLVLLALSNWAYLRAVQDRDLWRQLEQSGKELSRLSRDEVAAASVRRAALLLKADAAELCLYGTDGADPVLHRGGPDGAVLVEEAGLAAVGRPLLDDDRTQGVLTYASETLQGPEGPVGWLRVAFAGPVRLAHRDRQVLATFASTVSTCIVNAHLYEEMRRHADDKAHEAAHDRLTGLANRGRLEELVGVLLERAEPLGLLLVDLDHFKQVNDTLGHVTGDRLLQQVGRRLAEGVRVGDVVARLGGDEFAVLLPGVSDEGADRVAEHLRRVLAQPVECDGLLLPVEGSIGVACVPSDATTFEELLQRADVALYQAKGNRGSVSHYRSDRDDSSIERLALIAELREAVEDGQLVVHYQVQREASSGRPIGAEALVRWQHPTRGLLLPDAFVPAAEYSGLVRPFTLAVLDQAVGECARWQQAGHPLTVSVNLSARTLLDRQLPRDVAAVLARHGLPASRLVLEITETSIVSELEVVEEVLGALNGLGVALSVDDFGTGFSSLAFLQRVAVQELKIDRSFVSAVGRNENAVALVRATVQLAHGLGARAVAEGVETAELLSAMQDLGCDLVQGYHLGRPQPAQDVLPGLGVRALPPAPRRAPEHALPA